MRLECNNLTAHISRLGRRNIGNFVRSIAAELWNCLDGSVASQGQAYENA